MVLTKRGDLDLAKDEELVVRLTSTGGIFIVNGKPTRLVGKLGAYHFLPGVNKTVACRWNNCVDLCEKGYPRRIRYEVSLLLETPHGLETHRAFLDKQEHRAFAKIAEVLDLEGRDPREARILWRRRPDAKRAVEVTLI